MEHPQRLVLPESCIRHPAREMALPTTTDGAILATLTWEKKPVESRLVGILMLCYAS